MAFDQSTRNRLQKFVSNARAILGEEFTRQLQATYGLDPKQGTVAAIDSLTHLDNRQRQTAHLLRETLAHYLATTPGKGEKDRTKQVLDRIVREQAFTVLNRLAALRMAEARGFLLESIAKAHSSKGFQLYRQLSGTAHGETGDAYRNYLFSLFDEFSLDLAVLFDRHSAQGRLFPRETALLELLAEINHHEIEHLWAEDETIGWIYQYFNSQEERKKMRAESQAPRNSRELAVRNQFFTPRYVVEFLTDNTLGRIWYEMTQGNTALVDSCRYLVRRPTEIFLKPGETAPETEALDNEALSQEELLKQPVYIPHRPLKDPRSIRMLDPACGSMHFGLYAFDLFEHIYLEAWQLEQQLGPDAFTREAGQQALQSTYESLEAFKQQIPKLIIEHNIHGVDIDPRAVQIAGLSLWQRAQRAWHQQGIKPQQRPTIVKSNIVCAEPMPGEKALLQEFTSKLNPPVLGQLLETIFDLMQLAGEAGTLLKIEEEIQTAIHEAREQWLKQSGSNSVGDMFQAELDAATPQAKLGFDLRGIDDETFWDDAEQRILQALSDYADQAESNADQKRLFAEDAAKGFAFIDLCRKRFDVVLMNPPFGDYVRSVFEYVKAEDKLAVRDLFAGFIWRSLNLINRLGVIGCISSRVFVSAIGFSEWRQKFLEEYNLSLLADLGGGELDNAIVETAAYTIKRNENQSLFTNLSSEKNKELGLKFNSENFIDKWRVVASDTLKSVPGSPFCYWLPPKLLQTFNEHRTFEPAFGKAVQGLATSDDFRFLRARAEVHSNSVGLYDPGLKNDRRGLHWVPVVLGGEAKPFFDETKLVINWSDDGREVKAYAEKICGTASKNITNEKFYGLSGISFPLRTTRFTPKLILNGCIITKGGQSIFPQDQSKLFSFLGLMASKPFAELMTATLGRIDMDSLFPIGLVKQMPIPGSIETDSILGEFSKSVFFKIIKSLQADETSKFFSGNFSEVAFTEGLKAIVKSIDDASRNLYRHDLDYEYQVRELSIEKSIFPLDSDSVFYVSSYLLGVIFRRWNKFECLEEMTFEKLNEAWKAEVTLAQSPYDRLSDDCVNSGIIELESYTLNPELVSENKTISKNTVLTAFDTYLRNPKIFFDRHIKQYTFQRRQAPIYWPLQTPSGSYTLWVYYHRLNEQTLYTCVNDFVEPKLAQVEQDLTSLRSKSSRSSQEEKELEKLSDLASELRDFRDELLRLAKFWKPNLNDGVQITAAPLWKLFQHKAWQKKLKETWESLEKGDYDWAHLACSIWPERVLRKCHQDRSLAIAHDVEEHFWHEVEVPVKRGKKLTGETKLEWQPKDLSDAELTALVKRLSVQVNL